MLMIITNPSASSCFTCFSNGTRKSNVALFLSRFISFLTSSVSVGLKNKLLFTHYWIRHVVFERIVTLRYNLI